jgi:prophage DNA circulation protein
MADQTPKTIAQTVQNKEKEQVEASNAQAEKKAGVSSTTKKSSSLLDKIKSTVSDIKGKIDANKAKINSIKGVISTVKNVKNIVSAVSSLKGGNIAGISKAVSTIKDSVSGIEEAQTQIDNFNAFKAKKNTIDVAKKAIESKVQETSKNAKDIIKKKLKK